MSSSNPNEIAFENDDAEKRRHFLFSVRGMQYLQGSVASVLQGGSGLLILVAIEHFQCTPTQKWLLAASVQLGFFVGPLIVGFAKFTNMALGPLLFLVSIIASFCLGAAAFADNANVFTLTSTAFVMCISGMAPLSAELWRQGVRKEERGTLYGRVVFEASIVQMILALAISPVLELEGVDTLHIIGFFAVVLALGALFALRLPVSGVAYVSRNPLSGIPYLWKHPLFGYMSLAWMFLGFGNLMALPMRAEYVANEAFGNAYTIGMGVALLIVIPQIGQVLSLRIWGNLFDRMNFILMRMVINIFFLVSIVLFFIPSLPLQIIGAVCFGIGRGGGTVAWNLWVTKFAAPERTTDYMSVHTTLTGFRGTLGPFLAYALIGHGDNLWTAVAISAGCVFVGTIMLGPVLTYGRSDMQRVE